MRYSEAARVWQQIRETSALSSISSAQITNLAGLTDANITFTPNLNAIVGYNGSGKTTLLACLRGMLAVDAAERQSVLGLPRIQLADVKLELVINKTVHTATKSEGVDVERGEEFSVDIEYVDTATQVPFLQAFTRRTANLDEQLKQHDEYVFTKDELGAISFVVGKEYTRAVVVDLGDDYASTDPEQDREADDDLSNLGPWLPIFSVKTAAASYSTEHMGLGELAAFYLFWRLRSAPDGAIVLVEEPESFLAPRSQAHLITLIASLMLRKRIWVLLSTHSEHVLERLDVGAITVLARDQNGNHVARQATTGDEVLAQLRLDGRRAGTILVEDWGAFHFLREVVSPHRPSLLRRYKIVPVFGDGNISRLVTTYPREPSTAIVGVRDADQQGKIANARWPYLSLPGKFSPEVELCHAVKAQPKLLADRLGFAEHTITDYLGQLDGVDHHDFIGALSEKLGLGYEATFHHLVHVWKFAEKNSGLVEEFLERFDLALAQAEQAND